jgi:hypothetical protein
MLGALLLDKEGVSLCVLDAWCPSARFEGFQSMETKSYNYLWKNSESGGEYLEDLIHEKILEWTPPEERTRRRERKRGEKYRDEEEEGARPNHYVDKSDVGALKKHKGTTLVT